MENIVFILVLLLIGMGLARIPNFPENTASVLTQFVIHISLPALILVQIPKVPFSADMLVPALMPWAMIIVSAILVLVCARLFQWTRSVTGLLMLLVPLGNTSFFGIPMVETFFGSEHIAYAVLYDQFGTFLALATYGSVILVVYTGKGKVSPGAIVRKIITFPPFIALTLAFLFYRIPYPAMVSNILESLAATLIPLVIIAVGLKMEFRPEKEQLNPLITGLTIKLCIAPLIALGIIRLLDLDSPAAQVAVFEAGMPPQIGAWALAMAAGFSPKLGAMMVGGGILLSFATLSLLYQLL